MFMHICEYVLVQICTNAKTYKSKCALKCANTYYCDLVQICTIMAQTDDIKPIHTNEISMISHSHSQV